MSNASIVANVAAAGMSELGDEIRDSNFLGISQITKSYNNFMDRTIGPNLTFMFAAIFTNLVDVGKVKESIPDNRFDPRTKDWFLVDNPLPLLLILIAYVTFCTRIGPRIMRNRKPLKLTEVLLVYNVIQVIVSVVIFHEGLMGGWLFHYNFRCQPVDYSDNPVARRMANAVWYYYMCKIIELLDTVFFVLRKKDNQVSFLHMYHHTIMPVCAWIGVKWLPGGHGTLLGVINSFVHILMYTYYLVAALGPQYQKYLWWKKHLTSIQIIQFIIIIAHSAQLFIYDCNYPKIMIAVLGANTLFILVLFTIFYINSYIKNQKKVQ